MNSIGNKEKLLNDLKKALKLKNDREKIDFERVKIQLDLMYLVSLIMERNGWSKAILANKIGTSKAYISQLFSCDKKLNLETLAKIKFASGARFKFSLEENKLAELAIIEKAKIDVFKDENQNQLIDNAFLEAAKEVYKDKTQNYTTKDYNKAA